MVITGADRTARERVRREESQGPWCSGTSTLLADPKKGLSRSLKRLLFHKHPAKEEGIIISTLFIYLFF